MVKSKSTQHEMATSDFNKSKTNKSTYKSFHRQTGTYPYIAQKKIKTDQTAKSLSKKYPKLHNIPKI